MTVAVAETSEALLPFHITVSTTSPPTFPDHLVSSWRYPVGDGLMQLSAAQMLRRRRKTSHQCAVCGRVFVKGEHLRRHRLVHTEEKPFACDLCGKSYARRDTLQRHAKLHEDDGEQHSQSPRSASLGHNAKDSPHTMIDDESPDGTGVVSNISARRVGDLSTPADSPALNHAGSGISAPYQYDFTGDLTTFPEEGFDWNWIDPLDCSLPESFDFGFLDAPIDGAMPVQQQLPIDVTPATKLSGNGSSSTGQPAQFSTRSMLPMPAPMHTNQPTGNDHRTSWFSYVQSPPQQNEYDYDLTQQGDDCINDSHRRAAQSHLSNLPTNPSLPAATYLNRCMRQFTESFQCLLPIIHLPSFKPKDSNAWLVVAMCTIGSQLIDTPDAQIRGARMFESLHRAVLANWSNLFASKQDILAIMQAVVLGQAFAMLSPDSMHLVTAQAFHGTIVFSFQHTVKRVEELFPDSGEVTHGTDHQDESTLKRQMCNRLGYALRIQDTELALLCHQPVAMRSHHRLGHGSSQPYHDTHRPNADQTPEQDDQGHSPETADSGDDDIADKTNTSTSLLYEYNNLSQILADIIEYRSHPLLAMMLHLQETRLQDWLISHQKLLSLPSAHPLRLDCLWHSGWLALLCDLDLLEIASGRDGHIDALKASSEARAWAVSDSAQRALVHAFAIERSLATVTLSEVSALHVPRCAYHAGLVFCSLAKFASDNVVLRASVAELRQHRDVETMFKCGLPSAPECRDLERQYRTKEQLKEHCMSLASTLRRLRGWGISRNLAATLDTITA